MYQIKTLQFFICNGIRRGIKITIDIEDKIDGNNAILS